MAENERWFTLPNFSIQDFIDEQQNKNTLSRTRGDVALLKTFLVSLKETREIDAIQPAELDDAFKTLCCYQRRQQTRNIGLLNQTLTVSKHKQFYEHSSKK